MDLKLLPDRLATCRLPAGSALPDWAMNGALHSVSWTAEETSIVCDDAAVPRDVRSVRGWRALKIEGPLDFELTGILLNVLKPLAEADIAIFAVSTFDTDYILVKADKLQAAIDGLVRNGHRVSR